MKVKTLSVPIALRVAVLVALVFAGVFSASQQVQAAQTPTAYCSKYPDSTDVGVMLRSACRDGLKIADGKSDGAKCEDYALIADQAAVEKCKEAQKDRVDTISGKADIVSGEETEQEDTPTPTPTPSESPSTGGGGKNGSLLDILDETKNLSDYIDILHKAGPNANVDTKNMPDNEWGKYINGAGKKQDIRPDLAGGDNAPAIIIMNGGGWQSNDNNDDKIRNNTPDINGKTQTGPSIKQRGYSVFELTYRLGSSGVYYMYEDVMRGIEHVRNNAEMYNIDPNRIAIWGDSAGGSLAVRAGASGKSGAKVTVGWSPPTNAYTAIFKSYKSLMIGMDHSTCIPTDLAGLTNITDLLNGGSGDVAEYGQGLSSNGFNDFIGQGGSQPDAMSTIFQVLTAGQYALKTGQNIESISQQLEAAGNGGNPTIGSVTGSGLAGGLINLSSKKLLECMDNFEALSPALFASPDSTPMFLAGFTTDDSVGPDQVYGMHDKLQSLGIRSETKVIPGTDHGYAAFGPNPGNHLDYDARFVCPTLNFIDSILQPDNGSTNCETGQSENLGSAGGTAGGNACTSKVDSRIRIRSAQEVELSAVVVPNPDVSNGGVGDKVGEGGFGKETKSGRNKDVDGTTKNKPTIGNTNKSKDQSVGGKETQEAKQLNQGSSGGGTGGGSGGGGGGGACATGNSGTPATPNSPATPAGSGTETGSNGSDQKNPLNQLANLGGILSNLGGKGGGFGSSNSKEGLKNSTDTDTVNPANGVPMSTIQALISKGNEKRAAFKELGKKGSCAIDYSKSPTSKQAAEYALSVCDKYLTEIESRTGTLFPYAKPPIQISFVPKTDTDSFCNKPTTPGAETLGGAIIYYGTVNMCEVVVGNNKKIEETLIHEMTHLSQKYSSYNDVKGGAPFWFTEGVAEYMIYDILQDKKTWGHCRSKTNSHFKDGYACASAFFGYITKITNNPDLIKQAHTMTNKSGWTNSLLTKGTSKTLDQLWKDCLEAECKGGKP